MARRASRVDANQSQVVSALRAAGASVLSLAPLGKGAPDICCGFRGVNYLFELKHGKGKTNDLQDTWHAEWRGLPVAVAYGPDDALRAIGALS